MAHGYNESVHEMKLNSPQYGRTFMESEPKVPPNHNGCTRHRAQTIQTSYVL